MQLLAGAVMEEKMAEVAGQQTAEDNEDEDEDDEQDWPNVPCDLTPWMPMALFLQAEGNEWAVGRPKEVQDMFRKAVAAAKGTNGSCSSSCGEGRLDVPGDDLYGLLAGWNLVHVLLDGGQVFSVKEVVEVMAWVQYWKKQLRRWKGYEMINPRVQVLKEPCLAKFKVRRI